MSQVKYPEPQFVTLANGLKVGLWPLPHLHSVGVGLYCRMGSRYESTEVSGISHFLEHVLFRGNAKYETSYAMNRDFESWGGSINGFTTREYTYFYGRVHPTFTNEAIGFMADLGRQPSFAGVELEREIILEERLEDVDEDGLDLDIDDISWRSYWGEHPLAQKIIGTPQALRAITEDQIREHFKRFFCGPNLAICVTGRFDPDEIMPVLEEAFGSYPAGDLVLPEVAPRPFKPHQQPCFVTHEDTQIGLQLSFPGPGPKDPGYPSFLLLERILDDGMSSRLWRRIVEEMGLCYDLWAQLDVNHDFCMLEIGAQVASEKTVQLVETLYEELMLLRDQGPTEEELSLARRRLRFGREYALDQSETMNEYLGVAMLYDNYVPIEERIEQLEAVTSADIQAFMGQLLHKESQLFAAIGSLTKGLKKRLKDAMQLP
ncbi:MAG: insulinase family protein [Myxococcales bacterium]|nr:insulinase family protein [Myxococcales bacterium]MCB9642990.1 insulinase family protein [Myxococcales bacterium]